MTMENTELELNNEDYRVTIPLDRQIHKTIKLWCVENDVSLKQFIREAILHELEARGIQW